MALEECTKCQGLFTWSRMGPVVPGGKEREEVCCPHCGDVKFSEMTSQFFYVKEATEAEIAAWKNTSKKGADE